VGRPNEYKETQNGAYISIGLNIVITVILFFRFGLIGAVLGTLMDMLTNKILWKNEREVIHIGLNRRDSTLNNTHPFFAREHLNATKFKHKGKVKEDIKTKGLSEC
jgi:hypothetical protein